MKIYDDGKPILYDPAGTYGDNAFPEPQGFILARDKAALEPYIDYHLYTTGSSKVTTFSFDTSSDDESMIVDNILGAATAGPGQCAIATSAAIAGVGPFEELEVKITPGGLARALRKLKVDKEITIYVPQK